VRFVQPLSLGLAIVSWSELGPVQQRFERLLGQWPLTEHWQWDLRGDIGGFGVGSEFAWQVQGMLRWKVKTNMDVVASYRYMQMDYEQDGSSGLLDYNMVMSGPGLGVTFHF